MLGIEEAKAKISLVFTGISGISLPIGDFFQLMDSHAKAIGVLCTVIGLIFTVYYARKDDKRKQAEHEARLTKIKEE